MYNFTDYFSMMAGNRDKSHHGKPHCYYNIITPKLFKENDFFQEHRTPRHNKKDSDSQMPSESFFLNFLIKL